MVMIKKLVWDEWNIDHIARHQVVPEEVEEVCKGNFVIRDGKKGRFLIIGLTSLDRMISIFLDPEPDEGVYYPVTSRAASVKERKIYKQEMGDERK